MFSILKKDNNSRARSGTLTTFSGRTVETPAYAIVGTHAEVRCLPAEKMKDARVQLIIANTYHLWQRLGKDIEKFQGLHAEMNTPDMVIMTDSGGFQVFSLGFGREHGVGKVGGIRNSSVGTERSPSPADRAALRSHPGESDVRRIPSSPGFREFPPDDFLIHNERNMRDKNLVRITEEGAYFMTDDGERFLGPKLSMEIQEKLGADIILAFDECTSPEHEYEYQKQALARTHRWAEECIAVKTRNDQMLYGIVQGGVFEDLRKESSRYIGNLPFDGFAIGGSFGEGKMREVIGWSVSGLPEEKPRHLLGIGKIENILDGVAEGIDTFDCVIPTREARHGGVWTREGRFDAKKSANKNSDAPIEKGCVCPTCAMGVTRGMLFDMFHSKDLRAGEYATMHNIFFFNTFMSEMRRAIQNGMFREFEKETRGKLKK
jgi:tRNA-guanine transglycosylase